MRLADFVIARLAHLGVDTAFLVTGGGAMHLNDAVGATPLMKRIYCHHEQAAAMAAEVYARLAGKPALLNVTTGPGAINALNGVFGAYTDSVPMIVVSGQVKRETLRDFVPIPGLRQLGDQEADTIAMARPVTKWCALLRSAEEIADRVDAAWIAATCGRPGPAWLDIPVDLQGARLEGDVEALIRRPLAEAVVPRPDLAALAAQIVSACADAVRPVIFAGSGIRIAGVEAELLRLAEAARIPVVTAWAHDIFPNDHDLFAGRPGTIGTRAGNFVVQNADLVIVLGSRLNIRQVSYNYASFARRARKIWIDIDPAEQRKPFVQADLVIEADLRDMLPALQRALEDVAWTPRHQSWIDWCRDIGARFTPTAADYPESVDAINAYHFIDALFKLLAPGDIVVCGDATATIVPYQIGTLKAGMHLISNSGSASMGHDLPAAVGALAARPGARVICLAGDGSVMMNLQELQTLASCAGNVHVFVLNNDGYLSIKQTQRNFFGREAGSSPASGLTFPDFQAVGTAFGLPSCRLDREHWQARLAAWLAEPGPRLCDVKLDVVQEFEPRLKSRMVDGVITTPELDDMHPFLEPAVIDAVRNSALALDGKETAR